MTGNTVSRDHTVTRDYLSYEIVQKSTGWGVRIYYILPTVANTVYESWALRSHAAALDVAAAFYRDNPSVELKW